jgi:hypothetical protein
MLLNLLLPFESNWDRVRPQLQVLTAFAINFRYPGAMADKAIAAKAVKRCRAVRKTVRLPIFTSLHHVFWDLSFVFYFHPTLLSVFLILCCLSFLLA